jgi:hypothetical protein
MCIRRLVAHLFNLNFIFLSSDLMVAAKCAADLADVFYR